MASSTSNAPTTGVNFAAETEPLRNCLNLVAEIRSKSLNLFETAANGQNEENVEKFATQLKKNLDDVNKQIKVNNTGDIIIECTYF